ELLALVAAAERTSEHPLAHAIVASAKARGLEPAASEHFEAIPGHGIRATVRGKEVLVGNRRLMERHGIDLGPAEREMARLEGEGKTAVAAAVDGQAAGILAVADPVKPTSAEAIRLLHEMGVRVLMLTGDNRRTARAIARQVGIGEEDVIAEVLPEEKATAVERLQKEGLKVGMVGDGINDAPALA